MLEQTEVDASRIVIVEVSQRAATNEFMDFAHCAIEQERVVHHDAEIFTVCKLDQFLSLRCRCRKWLFYKNVLSALKGLLGKREVIRNRRDDGDGIDLRIRKHVGRVGRHPHRSEGLGPTQQELCSMG